MLLASSTWRLHSIDVPPGHLVTNRNLILTRALELTDVDVLLWLDADCAPLYGDPNILYRFLQAASASNAAIVGAPCARRGRGVNYVRLQPDDDSAPSWPFHVRAVGLGVTAYNVRWWRRELADRPIVDGAMHFFEWRDGVTEDYRACEFARQVGGEVLVDPRMGTVHDGEAMPGVEGRVVLQ